MTFVFRFRACQAVGWVVGFVMGDFTYTLMGWAAGMVLSMIVSSTHQQWSSVAVSEPLVQVSNQHGSIVETP